jgi:hypothetical protein
MSRRLRVSKYAEVVGRAVSLGEFKIFGSDSFIPDLVFGHCLLRSQTFLFAKMCREELRDSKREWLGVNAKNAIRESCY